MSEQRSDGIERLIIGWTCDDCDEAIGDEPRTWDLAEQLRKEHEEETGHTTTVHVVEEQRILPSQADRMEIGESMLDLAEDRSDRIEWICPECQRTGEELETTKRCPDCDERLREVLPDGGRVEDETEKTTNEKGSRNEREAANIIGRVRGSGSVEKVDGYSNTDPWNFADVIAIGDGKVLFVQVKTNRFSAKARRKYFSRMSRLDFEHSQFEVWVRVDYEGWGMYRYDPESEEFVQYIEMDTCDHEETVEAYRDAVGYYDDQRSVEPETDQSETGGKEDSS